MDKQQADTAKGIGGKTLAERVAELKALGIEAKEALAAAQLEQQRELEEKRQQRELEEKRQQLEEKRQQRVEAILRNKDLSDQQRREALAALGSGKSEAASSAALQELKSALVELEDQTPIPSTVNPKARFQAQCSSAYEDQCSTLVVKSLHAGGVAISNRHRSYASRPVFNDPSIIAQLKVTGDKLTPDFCAHDVAMQSNHSFPCCLVSTGSKVPPAILHEELSTPPDTPLLGPQEVKSEKRSVVFEYSLDETLWEKKLQQLENYVGYVSLTTNLACIGMAGVVFPSDGKFKAVQGAVSRKNAKFPRLTQLHNDGRLYYLVCDKTFVKDTSSLVSSTSRQLRKLTTVVVAMAKMQLDKY